MSSARRIFQVSELNREAKGLLESQFGLIWLEAEISNLARPASGHWYFKLKDRQAQISCACFRQRNRLINFRPQDGQQVLVRARVSLYEPRGDFQLIVDHMEPAGVGDLQQAYEQLKQKLEMEGLFDKSLKKPLPLIPRRIGIITSATGAALRDILQVLQRRYPMGEVILYPAMVQGEKAPSSLRLALRRALNHAQADVLIMARGGGSIEDLWAFNDEQLARDIVDAEIPIVSGVGHETDFTICDQVADRRAPTPSAAAEEASPDQKTLRQQVFQLTRNLQHHYQLQLERAQQGLDKAEIHLQRLHPRQQIKHQQQRLIHAREQLLRIMTHRQTQPDQHLQQLQIRLHTQHPARQLKQQQHSLQALQQRLQHQHPQRLMASKDIMLSKLGNRLQKQIQNQLLQQQRALAAQAQSLDALSPLATLSRGYSITYAGNSSDTLTQADKALPGTQLRTRLADGEVISEVLHNSTEHS